ncbi:hypothetical protein E6O75_ATG10596 [Venturia nashicola]|uniref:Uncharacterized protein n=1 Tax=Venturia nashicola TaxID=86259 RepID=A0A4Z1NTU6_9PEZI|nr:hypothetical protein E6O75_ATG10596 [Venturia nashicola]
MAMTSPPSEKPTSVRGPMDLYIERHATPSSSRYGLATPPLHPVHGTSKQSACSRTDWAAINANQRTEAQDVYYEKEDGYDMDIDSNNPSTDEDDFPNEDFEEEIQYYTHQTLSPHSPTTKPPEDDNNDQEQPSELDGHPHQILKIYGSHSHIILTASKISPLLTPSERSLLPKIKSRKDEATLGFPSGSHSYHHHLGPSVLRNASFDRLAHFLNSPELEKIKIDIDKYPDKNEWRRIKARTLWRTLYARAIRAREMEGILRQVGKQDGEREEVRRNREKIVGTRSFLFAGGYKVQSVEEGEEISWDEMLRVELEGKTKGMGPGERRGWLSRVYGARWTWYAMKFGLLVDFEEGDVVVRS